MTLRTINSSAAAAATVVAAQRLSPTAACTPKTELPELDHNPGVFLLVAVNDQVGGAGVTNLGQARV